jgi:hypothetical protein
MFFVVGPIAGVAIRFAAKKAAQTFIKKYGGKVVSNAGKRRVVSSTASGVKKFIDSFSKGVKKPTNVRGGSKKNIANKANKEDMIALTTKKKPSGGKITTTTKKSNVKSPVSKPKTNVPAPKPKPININMPKRVGGGMKNVTPPRGGGGGTRTGGGGRTGSPRTNPRAGGNLRKTVLSILNLPKVDKKVGKQDPPLIDNKAPAMELPKSKPKKIDPPKLKPKKKPKIGIKPKVKVKRNVPVDTKQRRKKPISKPDLSGLTGKFGVKGFSRTGSTMTDFLIGFTDGKGGKGRNYDKFMAKDKNGQYKVKTETLKSMGKRLKEKMKKKK